ncbi:ABC transporter permease subunit [Pluralibacter gergoviae]
MAAPLRLALGALVWLAVGIIYLPLLPAGYGLLTPALSPAAWRSLFDESQLPQALLASVVSSTVALAGALAITLCIIAAVWPSRRWQRLARRLPLMLAFPHLAFASAALLLFAEGGWLYACFPGLTAPVDAFGIGLGVTLALKESVFLLWVAYALLAEGGLHARCLALQSLGYGRWQCLLWVVLPVLLPQMGVALLATLAWTLSTVDVAIAIGPGNPPTLAVLAWQWLSRGDVAAQEKGALACVLLLLVMTAMALAGRLLWRLFRALTPDFRGARRPARPRTTGRLLAGLLPLSSLLAALALGLSARGELPAADSLLNSLGLGLLSALIALPLCLLWLAFGPRRFGGWIWLPLLLPALPLAAGQYRLALLGWLDGQWLTVLWGHLLWVLPWTLFILRPAWQQLDPRLLLTGRTLGWSPARCFWRITLPQLFRPLLGALAVAFSVSVAQYLPTQWLGGGRIPTLTTDAVALSSSGDLPQLAMQAFWQLLLPLIVFALTALMMYLTGRRRQGLR